LLSLNIIAVLCCLVLQRSNARGGGGSIMGGTDHVAIDMGGREHSPLMNEMNQMQIMEEQVCMTNPHHSTNAHHLFVRSFIRSFFLSFFLLVLCLLLFLYLMTLQNSISLQKNQKKNYIKSKHF
jgi:hypothetical protein